MRAFHQRRIAGSGIALRDRPGPVDPDHEKGQAPRSDSLQGRQPVGDLLETRAKAALKQLNTISALLACLQKPVIGHHQGGSEIAPQVAAEQFFGGAIGKIPAGSQRVNFTLRLDLAEQQRRLERSRCRV